MIAAYQRFDRGSSKGVPYNPYTGIFTIENEGLYLFYANMLRSSYTTSEINIKIDGQTRCTVYSSEDGSPHGSSSSCSTFSLNILKIINKKKLIFKLAKKSPSIYLKGAYIAIINIPIIKKKPYTILGIKIN